METITETSPLQHDQINTTNLLTTIILIGMVVVIGLIIYNYYRANQEHQIDHFDCGCGNGNIPAIVQPRQLQNEQMKNTQATPEKNTPPVVSENGKSQIILYYTTWCGHSQRFMPDWEKVKNAVANSDLNNAIVCVEYDCDKSREICSNSGIRGFPSLVLHKKDGTKVNYTHPQRTFDLVMSFINQNK